MENFPDTITVPTELAFDILDGLRTAGIWLGPKPHDWKPEKWPEYLAEEFGLELRATYLKFMAEMTAQIGVE